MSKLTLTAVLLFLLCVSNKLNAQQPRMIDMELITVTPADGTTVQSGATIPYKLDVKNLGPDALVAGDSLFLSLPNDSTMMYLLPKALAVGQSITVFTINATLKSDSTATTTFCAVLSDDPNTQAQINGQFVSVSYIDPDAFSNRSCVNITVNAGTTSIATVEENETLALYPNPAASIVYLPVQIAASMEATVFVRDITGREVLLQHYNQTGTTDLELDISTLPDGLYVMESKTGEMINKGRLLIRH